MEDIEDPTNLVGLAGLLNKSHTDEKLDLEALEKSYCGSTGVRVIQSSDPAKEFKDTIRDLSSETGISLGDESEDTVEEMEQDAPVTEDSPVESLGDTFDGELDPTMEADETISENREEQEMENMFQRLNTRTQSRIPPNRPAPTAPRPQTRPFPSGPSRPVSRPAPQTGREDHINEALRAYGGNSKDIDVEQENEEEMKSILLEDIDELRQELESTGVNVQRIPEVTTDSALEDIQKIHKILRRKYDRNRCNSFGTELILATAQGLEYAFDGKRKWGPYCPDLTGWHNTIRPKLRRMRYETSTIVSGIMQEYNIGPTARILLELVPSAFLYSKMRKEQHGKPNYSPDQMSEAYDDLRQFE